MYKDRYGNSYTYSYLEQYVIRFYRDVDVALLQDWLVRVIKVLKLEEV